MQTTWGLLTAGVRRTARTLARHADTLTRPAHWSGLVREMKAEASLRNAFESGQLELHYQPVINLATGDVVGFEALTRWREPSGGLGSFGPHVGVAEETGLILPIGAWVLREACEQLARWDAQGLPRTTVSVNVSGRQLVDAEFLPHLAETLRATAVDPDRLKLEITESTVMRDADEVLLWKIKDLGVSLHMDDFGTGYSSLSNLHRFPIDVLKVDRSFIRNTSACRDYAAVLHSVVALAHNLGMEVVAEGLEEPSQVALLRAMGCDYGQGFYFGRAVAAGEAAEFLTNAGRSLRTAG